jgi:hypothetical protein
MPLAGTEALLAAALEGSIESEIAAACGQSPVQPHCIDGLSLGIAKAIIPHIVSNALVTTAVAPHPPGGAAIGTGTVG